MAALTARQLDEALQVYMATRSVRRATITKRVPDLRVDAVALDLSLDSTSQRLDLPPEEQMEMLEVIAAKRREVGA